MIVLHFKQVGTLQFRYYGNHEIVMLRVCLIIYVCVLERLPEHYIFRHGGMASRRLHILAGRTHAPSTVRIPLER